MARQALLGNYGVASGALALAAAVSLLLYISWSIIQVIIGLGGWLGGGWSMNLLLMVLYSLFCTALSMAMLVGELRICWLVCDGKKPRLEDLFFLFSSHPLRFLGLWLILAVFSMGSMAVVYVVLFLLFMWATPFMMTLAVAVIGAAVIAGLFLMMLYSMALLVMVEDPERSAWECLRHSRAVMRGNLLRLVWLWISFIGIYLLGYVSFGIGFFWITPYVACTMIYFYKDCEAAAFPPRPSYEETDFWGNYRTE